MREIESIEGGTEKTDLPEFRTGDSVRVHVRVREGDKERILVFEGVVIQRRRAGAGSSFTVRKVSYGVGVERIFPLYSPLIAKLEVRARGKVRRARLFYLRDLRGKSARIVEKKADRTQATAFAE